MSKESVESMWESVFHRVSYALDGGALTGDEPSRSKVGNVLLLRNPAKSHDKQQKAQKVLEGFLLLTLEFIEEKKRAAPQYLYQTCQKFAGEYHAIPPQTPGR